MLEEKNTVQLSSESSLINIISEYLKKTGLKPVFFFIQIRFLGILLLQSFFIILCFIGENCVTLQIQKFNKSIKNYIYEKI